MNDSLSIDRPKLGQDSADFLPTRARDFFVRARDCLVRTRDCLVPQRTPFWQITLFYLIYPLLHFVTDNTLCCQLHV